MKVSINRHYLFIALIFAMLLSAVTHLFICFFMAVATGNPDYANMFNVLGLSLLFPALGTGSLNNLLGTLLVIGIGSVAYFYLEHQKRKAKKGSRK